MLLLTSNALSWLSPTLSRPKLDNILTFISARLLWLRFTDWRFRLFERSIEAIKFSCASKSISNVFWLKSRLEISFDWQNRFCIWVLLLTSSDVNWFSWHLIVISSVLELISKLSSWFELIIMLYSYNYFLGYVLKVFLF